MNYEEYVIIKKFWLYCIIVRAISLLKHIFEQFNNPKKASKSFMYLYEVNKFY